MDNPAHACQRAAAGFPTGSAVDSSHLRAVTGKISPFTLESSVQTLAYRIGKFFGSLPMIARASLVLLVCLGVFWFFTQERPKTEASIVRHVATAPKEQSELKGSCSEIERRAFQKFIINSGAKCATVDFCSSLSPVNTRVTCNGNLFAYRVRDYGRGFFVEVD